MSQSASALQHMVRLAQRLSTAFEAAVGMHLARWRILNHLHEHGASTQKHMKTLIGVDAAALTRQLQLLETEGLVRRRSHPDDQRLTEVALTAAGTDRLAAGRVARDAFVARLLAGLDAEALAAFEATLAHIGRNLDARTQEPDA